MLGGQGVAPQRNQPIVRLHHYRHMLSFGDGTYQPKTFRKGSEASSRAERRHGWEISFKSALLLVAEGVISTFFGDMPIDKMITVNSQTTLTTKHDYRHKTHYSSTLRRLH